MKKFGYILLAVVALAIVFFAWVIKSGNQQTDDINKVIDNYFSSLKAGDTASAYARGSKQFKESTSLAGFSASLKNFPALASFASYKVNYVSFADSAYSGTLVDTQGQEHTFRFIMKEEDNSWKINSLDVDLPLAEIKKDQKSKDEKPAPPEGKIMEVRVSDEAIDPLAAYAVPAFTPGTAVIHASVLTERQKGATVTIELVYMPTGDKLGPVTALPSGWYYQLGKGAFTKADFYFTKPTAGWLRGEYKLVATMSSGDRKEVGFSVR